MKYLLPIIVALVSALSVRAEYTAMTFKKTDGDKHVIALAGLTLNMSDGLLTAANATASVSIPLAQLESMEFSYGSSAATAIYEQSLSRQATAYTLDGVEAGVFSTVSEALTSLAPGTYVIKYADGTTLKIMKQ